MNIACVWVIIEFAMKLITQNKLYSSCNVNIGEKSIAHNVEVFQIQKILDLETKPLLNLN